MAYTETLILPTIVVVKGPLARSIGRTESFSLEVSIYRRLSTIIVPELIYAQRVLVRTFLEPTSPAILRHSENWINKLARFPVESSYWEEETDEWGIEEPFRLHEIFVNTLPGRVQQVHHALTSQPFFGLTSTAVIRAFQEAIREHLSLGEPTRMALGNAFIANIARSAR